MELPQQDQGRLLKVASPHSECANNAINADSKKLRRSYLTLELLAAGYRER